MSTRSKMIRKASRLPKGSVERRKILSSLQKQSMLDDYILPPGWDEVTNEFNEAMGKWYDGLRQYQEVMRKIERIAKRSGEGYGEVVDRAKDGQRTVQSLLSQRSAIGDDLYLMTRSMPEKG